MVDPLVNEKGEAMEPALHFHEFLFLLGLIAKNCITSKDDSIQTKLAEFYIQKLNFTKVRVADIPEASYDQILQMVTNDTDDRVMRTLEGDSGEEDEWESGSEQEEVLELIER